MADSYCVYIHTSPNGKRYIGITKRTAEKRWGGGLGYKRNNYFFSAIVKYGWDNFAHEIYAEKLSQKFAEEIEQSLIAKYKSKDRRFGYNHTDGGDGTRGCIPSAEVRLKMSVSHAGNKSHWFGKHLTEETRLKMSDWRKRFCKNKDVIKMMHDVNPNKKAVYQYSKDGELMRVWDGRHQAENEFFKDKKALAIGKCCQGDCNSAYGYIWSYSPLEEIPCPIHQRKVYQYSKSAELISVWENLDIAIKQFRENQTSTVINQCVSGHRPVAYGFIWSYIPLQKEVI